MTEVGDRDRLGKWVAPIVNVAAYGRVTNALRDRALMGLPPHVEVARKAPNYPRGS